jgi:hypothetical protein
MARIPLPTGLATLLLAGACTGGGSAGPASTTIEQPPVENLEVAPDGRRVDLTMPSFFDPTRFTNPLFPVGQGRSNLMLGTVDDKAFRAEITVLSEPRIIEWGGRRIETTVAQYTSFLDGRIDEVALDLYAQANDGSVWYLGEDVFNYQNGVIADTEGTWFAGKDGPPAMIMPAKPRVGDAYRPENIPGLVFEEVTVGSTGRTVDGPSGPVDGAIEIRELHMDGGVERKTFAPGYGELFTGAGGDVEVTALAIPTDARPGPIPAELEKVSAGAAAVFDAARSEDWKAASAAIRSVTSGWERYRGKGVPPMIGDRMIAAVERLSSAVAARHPGEAGQAAIDVAQASLDLQLQYLPPAEIDLGRLELWARQLLLDLEAGAGSAVAGDLATLEWVRDRIAHAFRSAEVSRVDRHLGDIRLASVNEDVRAAAGAAARLRETLALLA